MTKDEIQQQKQRSNLCAEVTMPGDLFRDLIDSIEREARQAVWEEAAQLIEGYQLPDGWKMARLDEKDATTAWLQRIISRCREQAKGDAMTPCAWTQDGFGEDHYDTSCGRRFSLNDGVTPLECKMRFCCYCGRPLEERLETEERNDDEEGSDHVQHSVQRTLQSDHGPVSGGPTAAPATHGESAPAAGDSGSGPPARAHGIGDPARDSLTLREQCIKLARRFSTYLPEELEPGDEDELMHYIEELVTAQTIMIWTTEKPTQVGWYWYRETHNDLFMRIIRLRFEQAKGYRPGYVSGISSYEENFTALTGEWAGPIPLPQEARA